MCSVLVRSSESLDKQNLSRSINESNRRVNQLQSRLSTIIGESISTSTEPICKPLIPMCSNELASTKYFFNLYNLCCKTRTVNRRIKQLEKIIDNFTNQSNFPPLIPRRDRGIGSICCKVKNLRRRVNRLEFVINSL